jgi:hypothetical protein
MMSEFFGDQAVMETDFSSFEAHHRGVFSRVMTKAVRHVLGAYGEIEAVKIITDLMTCRNVIEFKGVTCKIDERLMSGALWTSSTNGLLNLMIMSYLVERTVRRDDSPEELADLKNFREKVEGDDGLCVDVGVPQELINGLGIVLKFKTFPHYSLASFCGVNCSEVTKNIVADPNKVFRKFFVLPTRYKYMKESKRKALLRAKALSYKYNYTHTPIIGAMCDWVLRRTSGVDTRGVDKRDMSWMENMMAPHDKSIWREKSNPCSLDRLHFEDTTGIPPQLQRFYEECFEAAGDVCYADLSYFESVTDRQHVEDYILGDSSLFASPEALELEPSVVRRRVYKPNAAFLPQ